MSPQQKLQQAQALMQRGRLDEAMKLANQLPAAAPKYNLQLQLMLQRNQPADLSRAEKIVRSWRKQMPANPDPLLRLTELYWRHGEPESALKTMLQAHKQRLQHPHIEYYLGVAYQLCGNLQQAMASYRQAIARNIKIKVDDSARELEAAIELYETAAGQYPGSPGSTETELVNALNEYDIMKSALNRWWQQQPDLASLHAEQRIRYGNANYNLGCRDMASYNRVHQAISWFDRTLAINPSHLLARLNRLFVMNYDPALTPAVVAAEHRSQAALLRTQAGAPETRFANNPDPDKRLRIAYLSSDFRKHSVVHFILPVLRQHRRGEVEVFAYYNEHKRDRWTRRVSESVDRFTAVADMDTESLLRRIRADGIDILVDLNGYTKGHRVDVVSRRAAPIQVAWIGYPNTSGLDVVDYRIVDAITDPEGSDELASEQLLRLPNTFSVYLPPDDIGEPVTELPARKTGRITLGSFNFHGKLNPTLLAAWGKIMAQLDRPRLLVKNMFIDQPRVKADLAAALEAAGIPLDRVELLGRTEDPAAHCAIYNQVDLALDSYPYNGTTTTCDSLYMGVPVLSCRGGSHISRVSASQLNAVGLNELVCSDLDEYVAKAVALGRDWDKLDHLRQNLRATMQASPLMDYTGFTARLEAEFRNIWRRWCRDQNQ